MKPIATSLLLGLAAMAAHANTITVNSLADPGSGSCSSTCTLRDAIATASPGDTILFSESLSWPATLTLSGSELLLYKDLDIVGPGRDSLTIDGNHASRLFEIAGLATVSISELTLLNGARNGADGGSLGQYDGKLARGGAIRVQPGASLALEHVNLGHNEARGGQAGNPPNAFCTAPRGNGGNASGGAIYSEGVLTIHHANLVDNRAVGGSALDSIPAGCQDMGEGGDAIGGAIWSSGTTELVDVEFLDSAVQGGQGGEALPSDANAGDGGNAIGGALYLTGYASLAYVTSKRNLVEPGMGGSGDVPGRSGVGGAVDIHSSDTTLLRNVAFDSETSLWPVCFLPSPVFQGLNYANQQYSCHGFQLQGGTFGSDPAYLEVRGSGTHAYAIPLEGSSLLDRISDCTDTFNQPVTEDVRGMPRPLDSDNSGTAECEIGAVEVDQPLPDAIFAGGFD